MAERRPLVLVNGEVKEIPDTDTLPATLVPQSAAFVDGGSPSTNTTAPYFRVDFGGVT